MVRYPAFVPFVGTNSSPTIQGADSALWQRIVVIPFEIQRLDDDKRTDKMAAIRLMSDLASKMAILAWLVDGYTGYAREGLAGIPAGVTGATKSFRGGVSEWHSFMNEAIEQHPGHRILVQDLYQMYRLWGMMNDIPDKQMGTKRQFDFKLEANSYPIRRMKKPASQSKANYLIDYKLKPGADGTEVTSDGTESLEGSEGSVQFNPWSPQKYAEIQGSEED
jgi:putative DNA primase/helicase